MSSSPSIAENGTAPATTEASTFQLQAGGCVQSPRTARAEHFAWLIECEIRELLQRNGLRTNRIAPRYQRIRKGRFNRLRHITLTMTCVVEGTAEEVKQVRDQLKLALLHLPARRVKLSDTFTDCELCPSQA
jgi:hypothetical protein